MSSILAGLDGDDKSDACISFVLKFRTAIALNNYSRAFKLYNEAPKMCGYLIDWFLPRLRKAAMKSYIKLYVTGSIQTHYYTLF